MACNCIGGPVVQPEFPELCIQCYGVLRPGFGYTSSSPKAAGAPAPKPAPPPAEAGYRDDAGKLPFDLIDPLAEEELAAVLQYGVNKGYSKHNWREGLNYSRCVASLRRHLNAMCLGEYVDPESHCLHSAHIMANAMFLTRYMAEPETYHKFDDLKPMHEKEQVPE